MKTIIFKSLKLTEERFNQLRQELKGFAYTDERGEGAQITESGDSYLRCDYLYEKRYVQNNYNPVKNEFEKVEYTKIETIPFIIDLAAEFLEIIGNKQKAFKITKFLDMFLKGRPSIADTTISPAGIISTCKEVGLPYSVNNTKIMNYIFFDKVSGECILNLSNYAQAADVLAKYDSKIAYFSATILYDEVYFMTFYKSGAISLSHKDMTDVDIEFIRLFRSGIKEEIY